MIIESLDIKDFRNIENGHIEFIDGINILAGQNAQGKTNILEAINFCSCFKSRRALKDMQLIRFTRPKAELKLIYAADELKGSIGVCLTDTSKKIVTSNGVKVDRLRDQIGIFKSILFTPDNLTLIKEGPGKRREFMDLALCQMDIKYTDALLKYQKVLRQRNMLLKQAQNNGQISEELLEAWDSMLCKYGGYIAARRHEFIESIDQNIKHIYAEITKKDEKLKIIYLNQFSKEKLSEKQYEQQMIEKFRRMRDKDIEFKMTLCGIQKDDMLILQKGKSMKFFSSQGQIRSAVLALLLAQSEVIYQNSGVYPVLLLDDILSELDRERQRYIFSGAHCRQCIITTCEMMKIRGKGARTYIIKNGTFVRK